jgi:hypothetical protein
VICNVNVYVGQCITPIRKKVIGKSDTVSPSERTVKMKFRGEFRLVRTVSLAV